jgi:hypothetical protein
MVHSRGPHDDDADLEEIQALQARLAALKPRGADSAVVAEIGHSLKLVAADLQRLAQERVARNSVDPKTPRAPL